jgi:hypothetical protein
MAFKDDKNAPCEAVVTPLVVDIAGTPTIVPAATTVMGSATIVPITTTVVGSVDLVELVEYFEDSCLELWDWRCWRCSFLL